MRHHLYAILALAGPSAEGDDARTDATVKALLTRILLLVVMVATAQVAAAQLPLLDSRAPRSALAGTIRDTAGRPLPVVTVSADGQDRATVSDSAGSFHLDGIPAGTNSFTVTRIGYKAVTFDATLPPDSTVFIEIRMRSAQTLPTVEVSGERRSARLVRDGFYDRQQIGLGKYIAPEEVEKLSPLVSTPAQLLRNINGIRLDCSARARSQTGGCIVFGWRQREKITEQTQRGCMALFIDGVYVRGELDENLSVGVVYAMEVYNRGAIVPAEFAHPSTARCGAILVWTRSRVP